MEAFSFWSAVSIYRQFKLLFWAEILILITLLISCDSQGDALSYPDCEGAAKTSQPLSHFTSPILRLWHWSASLSLLEVGFFPQMSANHTELWLSNSHPTPQTYITATHSTDLCLSFSNERGTASTTSCMLLSLRDKYGSPAHSASTWWINGAFS